jgi:FtsP/CotA-like multicopper oxidase with cupredoxin domain
MGGLAGAIVVRPSGEENLPTSISNANEHILVLTPMYVGQEKDNNGYVTQGCSNSGTCDPDTQPPDCTTANAAQSTTFAPFRKYSYRELSAATGSTMNAIVTLTNLGTLRTSGSWSYYENEMQTTFTNGQFEPSITVNSNEVVTFRIVHAGIGEELKLQMRGNCQLQVIAWDGIYLNKTQAKTGTSILYLMAGARVDVQMSCSGGSGEIEAANQYSKQKIITLNTVGGSATHAMTTSEELQQIIRPYYLYDMRDKVADVYYSNHVSQGNRPLTTCGGKSMLTLFLLLFLFVQIILHFVSPQLLSIFNCHLF